MIERIAVILATSGIAFYFGWHLKPPPKFIPEKFETLSYSVEYIPSVDGWQMNVWEKSEPPRKVIYQNVRLNQSGVPEK